MKYIDYIKTRIKTLADPKLLEFPESDEMIQRKIVTEQRRQKRKENTYGSNVKVLQIYRTNW